jgi:hypothetical protein
MTKRLLYALPVLLILMQFIKPRQNLSNNLTYDVSTKYAMPDSVKQILDVACADCHSNKTTYPWYASIQPIASFLDHHVTDGKRHYNLSEFTKLPIAVQNHKFEETIEQVKEKEMPLASYTYFGLHPDAKLTDAQRNILIDWAQAQMDSLKAKYPADSLVLKRRRP